MKYVVDTYALIWFLEGNSRLGANARTILSEFDHQLVLPAIALAEAVWIVERGKTSIPSVSALLSAVSADSRVMVYPPARAVIDQGVGLTAIHEMRDRQNWEFRK